MTREYEEEETYRSQETYEEKLDRWKQEWTREIDNNLANGR